MSTSLHPTSAASRLGCYVLPGGVRDPRPAIEQAATAERLGLGTVFVGERYDTKDLPSLVGALSQTTSRVRLAGAVTHIGTRHPMVLASIGQTLQALTGGRFVLGFGRGSPGRWHSYGIPVPTTRMLEDTASVLRRLWAGERVAYSGPAGEWPALQLVETIDLPPPKLLLAGVGPQTLALGGRAFDIVVLHPLLTPEAVARSVAHVRDAAAAAGRDPQSVEVHATVLVAADREETETRVIIGARALGYLLMSGLGDALIAANQWDASALAAVRAHPRFAGLDYTEVKKVPVADLAEVSAALPTHWLHEGTATGDAATCAARLSDYLQAGADAVLLHGSTIDGLTGVVEAFARAAPTRG
jgi:probable F420-dependent oxidoreductase